MATTKELKELVPTENQEQRALVRWIRLNPAIAEDIVKLNNEGERSEALGWHLKMMGMCRGASDLFLMVPQLQKDGTLYHGLWIEMKRNKKYTPSEKAKPTWIAQEKFQARARQRGYAAEFVFGWEKGSKLITDYLAGTYIPTYT